MTTHIKKRNSQAKENHNKKVRTKNQLQKDKKKAAAASKQKESQQLEFMSSTPASLPRFQTYVKLFSNVIASHNSIEQSIVEIIELQRKPESSGQNQNSKNMQQKISTLMNSVNENEEKLKDIVTKELLDRKGLIRLHNLLASSSLQRERLKILNEEISSEVEMNGALFVSVQPDPQVIFKSKPFDVVPQILFLRSPRINNNFEFSVKVTIDNSNLFEDPQELDYAVTTFPVSKTCIEFHQLAIPFSTKMEAVNLVFQVSPSASSQVTSKENQQETEEAAPKVKKGAKKDAATQKKKGRKKERKTQ